MVSLFELFKVGIGPSSSHTVGPMRAASSFVRDLAGQPDYADVARIDATLYGSLAWTGRGHGTAEAVILGLCGKSPESIEPDQVAEVVAAVRALRRLRLPQGRGVHFTEADNLIFDFVAEAPVHPNTLSFAAFDGDGRVILEQRWCSVGGGFVVPEAEVGLDTVETVNVPFDFSSGRTLLDIGRRTGLSIAEIVRANEHALRTPEQVTEHLDRVIRVMMSCVDRGLVAEGELPGGLFVKRRAKALKGKLEADHLRNARHPHEIMDWVSLYAIAVNEENAAGGRVVTAPTNGAAGVVPAVLSYYQNHCTSASRVGMENFLLAATAIGGLFKKNASISGAEVGCQGEVGVACSMAAAGLAAALGASNEQVENAAEIGMEHHLGMTCDPIGGLVQVPCIERNAFGAVAAVQAASLAMRGDGQHIVSLDKVIATMRETGRDMATKYKETSQGGLAVNHPEC
ncbi:L-serine ammonia-lyase [Aureimonas fodinaquatilis]|uniref:L-serine dehydratase n=1 Tax=Aureimonas fodinaquatilis TaxID=2565783 RepID=A0A5B0E541_9HYPH|nr:L-serine ammonia-lyase [Aureimonas fodinaquatilis]KAA0972549.1 L-serine ammonia-lyase [Aureimonas fodinaquatilis]